MGETTANDFHVAIEWFTSYLALQDASSYTCRSYRQGLSHFARWAVGDGLILDAVDRRSIAAYIASYATNGDGPRAPRTINHRLSVLSSFFATLIRRDNEQGGAWVGRPNPVPQAGTRPTHGMAGRDAPPRGRRAELRRREPKAIARGIDPEIAEKIARGASSARDRAILLLLIRTGQRIGEWSNEHGRHGVLGMRLSDFDRRESRVIVVLKGSRDEHAVPVTEDFWPVFDAYLAARGDPPTDAAWVGSRRGTGRPLTYDAFDAMLRSLTERMGLGRISAHQFRHTLANEVTKVAGLKVAQELLAHRHYSTTADSYTHADQAELVDALAAAATRTRRHEDPDLVGGYAFAYDQATIAELDALGAPRLVEGPSRD